MKKIVSTLAIAASVLVITSPALPASHFKAGMIRDYDLNGDNKVSKEEFAQVRRARFANTDTNGDGTISPAEYLTEFEVRYESMLKERQLKSTQHAFDNFRKTDTNKDYVLTAAEYKVASDEHFYKHDPNHDGRVDQKESNGKHKGLYKKYDTNGDNIVLIGEHHAVRDTMFKNMDKSGNGVLSRIEYVGAAEAAAVAAIPASVKASEKQTKIRFKAIDKDENGAMSWEEFEASGIRMFDRLDTNKDGFIADDDPAPKREQQATQKPKKAKASAAR
ncbi:hypothetical protein [Kordiimonas laminariae]|uniref:hypothetical protein n=1 Tax=Kordiimonas laminariae TaxID=2917717 RepID=UPI001FF18F39|nr:hypothetical protein [Kordiimonas laminariae]MCK0069436.1 hypothetical protein [Kordiimonas laminariae]